MNALSLVSTTRCKLCGDCFELAKGAGAFVVTGERIDLGEPCELHGRGTIQATRVVEVPDVYVAELARQRGEESVEPIDLDVELPERAGPVTELAARLLCAWSQGDMAKADDLAVVIAADRAKALLRATKGA